MLDAAVAASEPSGWAVIGCEDADAMELQRLGMVSGVKLFIAGKCGMDVTPRGLRYRSDLAEWEEARRRERFRSILAKAGWLAAGALATAAAGWAFGKM